jgi:hypothetical protein
MGADASDGAVACAEETVVQNGYTSSGSGPRSVTVGDIMDELAQRSDCDELRLRFGTLLPKAKGVCVMPNGNYEVFFAESRQPESASIFVVTPGGEVTLQHSPRMLFALRGAECRRLE